LCGRPETVSLKEIAVAAFVNYFLLSLLVKLQQACGIKSHQGNKIVALVSLSAFHVGE